MKCSSCGTDIGSGESGCTHCQANNQVKVLSRRERENFSGVTIDDDRQDYTGSQYQGGGTHHRERVHQVNIAVNPSSWVGKLIIAAVLAMMVFFFLPLLLFIFMVAGAIGVAVWIIHMLRK